MSEDQCSQTKGTALDPARAAARRRGGPLPLERFDNIVRVSPGLVAPL